MGKWVQGCTFAGRDDVFYLIPLQVALLCKLRVETNPEINFGALDVCLQLISALERKRRGWAKK